MLVSITGVVAASVFMTIVGAAFIASRTVNGTVRHYKAVTVIMTAFWPPVLLSSFCVVAHSMDRNLLSSFIAVAQIVMAWIEWNRYKDDDNWWKGRGKKTGRAIKGLFEGPASTSLAGGVAYAQLMNSCEKCL